MTTGVTRRELAIALAAVALAVAVVVWFHAAVVVEWRRSASLGASGVLATGEVIGNESLAGPRADGHRITYRYVAPGPGGRETVYSSTRDVDRATYDALSIGSEVEVRYDPDDPQRSDLARNDRLAMMLFVVGLIDLALIVAGVSVVRGARAEATSAGPGVGAAEPSGG